MSDQRTIVSNTADLFQWQNAIFADPALSQGQKVVAVRLINHLNLKKADPGTGRANPNFGLCNPGIETIAAATGMTRRGVQLVVAKLITSGWIEREIVRGRSHSNRYRFLMLKVGQANFQGPENAAENANVGSHFIENSGLQNANGETVKCERPSYKMRIPVRPNSKNNYNSARARGSSGLVGAPDGADGPPMGNLGPPGLWLRNKLGVATYEAWLRKVAVVSEDGNRLTLSAPTAFLKSYIASNFETAILDSWRRFHPTIARLDIVVREASSGVTPISSRRGPQPSLDARWLVDVGRLIVRDRMLVSSSTAQETIVRWLQQSGNDAAGVAQIISAADAQNLVGENFRNVVNQKARELKRESEGPQLPFGPTPVRRHDEAG